MIDLKKTGEFLKSLRKESGRTQQELADLLNVSTRTVSRWETGNNLPDLDLLLELAGMYHVSVEEILGGHRNVQMQKNEKEKDMLMGAAYENERQMKFFRRSGWMFVIGFILLIVYMIIVCLDLEDSAFLSFFSGLCLGSGMAAMLVGISLTFGYFNKIRAFKERIAGSYFRTEDK